MARGPNRRKRSEQRVKSNVSGKAMPRHQLPAAWLLCRPTSRATLIRRESGSRTASLLLPNWHFGEVVRQLMDLAELDGGNLQVDTSCILVDPPPSRVAGFVASQPDQVRDGIERKGIGKPVGQFRADGLDALSKLGP